MKGNRVAQYNLADRESSTLLLATDSLDLMFEATSAIVTQDGPEGLQGLSLSVFDAASGAYDDFDDTNVITALETLRAETPSLPHS